MTQYFYDGFMFIFAYLEELISSDHISGPFSALTGGLAPATVAGKAGRVMEAVL